MASESLTVTDNRTGKSYELPIEDGTVLASFNVEEFGTERVARLTREEIDERFDLLREMTNFDVLPASAK